MSVPAAPTDSKYFGKAPTPAQLSRLKCHIVKIHLQGTRWISEDSNEAEAFIKSWVEAKSGAEVVEVVYQTFKHGHLEGEHTGYTFVKVRKEHAAQVVALCDNQPCEEMDVAHPEFTKAHGPTIIRAQISKMHYVDLGWEKRKINKPQFA